ncbi:MAG: hypothetical protein H4O13_16695 [Xanthomonadales bacterium]|nr:hypothetical protein [Xanthomonadales bacterium]
MLIHATRGSALLLLAALALPLRAAEPIDAAAVVILERHAEAPLLVLGELHGTVEAPAVVGTLAARLLDSGALTVALEIPAQEQARLDAYLASDGSRQAQRELLDGEFWRREPERSDGRRSRAMFALIEQLRLLRSTYPELRLLAFDDTGFFSQTGSRDALMSDALRAAHAAHPEAKLLVLTGNYHARLDQPRRVLSGDKWLQPPLPMAAQLQDLGAVSIHLSAVEGEHWACRKPNPCGVIPLPRPTFPPSSSGLAAPNAATAAVPVRVSSGGSSFHLKIELPRLSASEPMALDDHSPAG